MRDALFVLGLLALAPAAAALPLPAGQYTFEDQITGLLDPASECASFLQVGHVEVGVATLHGLGNAWTYTSFQNVQSPPYGLYASTCSISALPAATAFTGSPPSAPAPGTSTCLSTAPGSQTVVFVFSNNSAASPPSSVKVTSVPTPGADDQLRFDYTNAAVTLNGATLCYLSGSSILLRG